MNLNSLLAETVAAIGESQQGGDTPVALGFIGLPPQSLVGIVLVDGVALIELPPDSLVQTLLDTDLAVPEETEGETETVNHIAFIQTLCQTFMARSGPLTAEVRAALGRLGRCGDFRTVVEVAIQEAKNYAGDAADARDSEFSGTAG